MLDGKLLLCMTDGKCLQILEGRAQFAQSSVLSGHLPSNGHAEKWVYV